jgi:hypothetical protein
MHGCSKLAKGANWKRYIFSQTKMYITNLVLANGAVPWCCKNSVEQGCVVLLPRLR